jgi:hypothetical protein
MKDPLAEPNLSPEPLPPASAPETVSVDPFHEMRMIVYGLFAALILVSLALNVFVYKQNNRVQAELDSARKQLAQLDQGPLQQNRSAMANLLQEVAGQIPAHPEAQQILARYNISVQPATAAAPAPSSSAVAVPEKK